MKGEKSEVGWKEWEKGKKREWKKFEEGKSTKQYVWVRERK
jgi:hypothetical protein